MSTNGKGSGGRSTLHALQRLDKIAHSAISDRVFPGCVMACGQPDSGCLQYFAKGYGTHTYESNIPATAQSIFDVASLTKVMAAVPAVMLLYESGQIDIDKPVCEYMPEFGQNGKEAVTIAQVLSHTAGLRIFYPFHKMEIRTPQAIKDYIFKDQLWYPLGETHYSDLSMLVIGFLVEHVSKRPLDRLVTHAVFRPLGMHSTGYRPIGKSPVDPLVVPTEVNMDFRGRPLWGEVHDPNAYLMEGVAGHAGLFSCITDMARFCYMMLMGGLTPDGRRLFKESTIHRFTQRIPGRRAVSTSGGDHRRALGWDMRPASRSKYSSSGTCMSKHAYGHTGFTGTSMWLDPKRRTFVILLTNAVHPWAGAESVGQIQQVRAGVSDECMALMDAVQTPFSRHKTAYMRRKRVERTGGKLDAAVPLASTLAAHTQSAAAKSASASATSSPSSPGKGGGSPASSSPSGSRSSSPESARSPPRSIQSPLLPNLAGPMGLLSSSEVCSSSIPPGSASLHEPRHALQLEHYHVQPGDRVLRLARERDMLLTEVAHLNPNVDLDNIHIGDTLWLVAAPKAPTPPLEAYTVRAGDRVAILAYRRGMTLAEAQEVNPKTDLNQVQAGAQLWLRPETPSPSPDSSPRHKFGPSMDIHLNMTDSTSPRTMKSAEVWADDARQTERQDQGFFPNQPTSNTISASGPGTAGVVTLGLASENTARRESNVDERVTQSHVTESSAPNTAGSASANRSKDEVVLQAPCGMDNIEGLVELSTAGNDNLVEVKPNNNNKSESEIALSQVIPKQFCYYYKTPRSIKGHSSAKSGRRTSAKNPVLPGKRLTKKPVTTCQRPCMMKWQKNLFYASSFALFAFFTARSSR